MTRFSPFMFGCGLSFPPNNSEVSQCHSVTVLGRLASLWWLVVSSVGKTSVGFTGSEEQANQL